MGIVFSNLLEEVSLEGVSPVMDNSEFQKILTEIK